MGQTWWTFTYAAAKFSLWTARRHKQKGRKSPFSPSSVSWNQALCLIRSIKPKHVHEENMIFHTPWRVRLNEPIRQTHGGEKGGFVAALACTLLRSLLIYSILWKLHSPNDFNHNRCCQNSGPKAWISHTQMSILVLQAKWKSFQTNDLTKPPFHSSLRIIWIIKRLLSRSSKINTN